MTLLELLERYDFRYCRPELDIGHACREDSCTVRIYLGDRYLKNWFEIGVNSWTDSETKIERLKFFMNEEILNRQVYCFDYNEDINVLCIELLPVIRLATEE